MRKGIVVSSVINVPLAAMMALLGLGCAQPIRAYFLTFSITLVGCSLVLLSRDKNIHNVSIFSSYVAAVVSALGALSSLTGLLTFSNSWLMDLLSFVFFLIATIYLIGYRGYLLEFKRELQT